MSQKSVPRLHPHSSSFQTLCSTTSKSRVHLFQSHRLSCFFCLKQSSPDPHVVLFPPGIHITTQIFPSCVSYIELSAHFPVLYFIFLHRIYYFYIALHYIMSYIIYQSYHISYVIVFLFSVFSQ